MRTEDHAGTAKVIRKPFQRGVFRGEIQGQAIASAGGNLEAVPGVFPIQDFNIGGLIGRLGDRVGGWESQ